MADTATLPTRATDATATAAGATTAATATAAITGEAEPAPAPTADRAPARRSRPARCHARRSAALSDYVVAAAIVALPILALVAFGPADARRVATGGVLNVPPLPDAPFVLSLASLAGLVVVVASALAASAVLRRRLAPRAGAVMARTEPDAVAAASSSPPPSSRLGSSPPEAVAAGAATVAPLDEQLEAIGTALIGLRRQHGVRYGSRTWVEDVLPRLGQRPTEPLLARDLLAAGALVAAGVSPDLAALTSAHPLEHLTSTTAALLGALDGLAARLAAGEDRADLPPYEAVRWAA